MSRNFLVILDEFKLTDRNRFFEQKLNFSRNINLLTSFLNNDSFIFKKNNQNDLYGNDFICKFKYSDIDFEVNRKPIIENFILKIEEYHVMKCRFKFLNVFRGEIGKFPIVTFLTKSISHFIDTPTLPFSFNTSLIFFNDLLQFIDKFKFGNYFVKINNKITRLETDLGRFEQIILEFDKAFKNEKGLENRNLMIHHIDLNFLDQYCGLRLDSIGSYYLNFYIDVIDCLFYVSHIKELNVTYDILKSGISFTNLCLKKFKESFFNLKCMLIFCPNQETTIDLELFIRMNKNFFKKIERNCLNKNCLFKLIFN